MGVSIPNTYEHDVDVTSFPTITMGSVGPVTIAGIPDTYHIDITHLPKIRLSIDPLRIEPIDVSLRLKEIPSIRAHIPMNYCLGLAFLGVELVNLKLCGESQVITEPYKPNPCEVCGPPRLTRASDSAENTDTISKLKED